MKKGKRIVALALAVVMALGSVCYKPPKAEAVVVETAVALAAAYTYLAATGFSFAGDGTAYGAMADVFESEMQKHMNEYSETVEVPNLVDTIANGVTLFGNGVVEFSAAAANALAGFGDWLVDKLGLLAGSSSVGFVGSVLDTHVSCNGVVYPKFPDAAYGYDNLVIYQNATTGGIYSIAFDGTPSYDSKWNELDLPGRYISYVSTKSGSTITGWGKQSSGSSGGSIGLNFTILYSSITLFDGNGAVVIEGSEMLPVLDLEEPALSVSLSADYEAAPTVDEQYSMVVNTGLTYADEQSFIDAVLGSAVAGSLAPSYTIEAEAAGDIVTPGEDTDTQTGILSWVKKIWQSVAELPATIAQAVAAVFVPSAEYIEALPATVATAFDDRTGFLTYPASVLYDFADMLSAGSQDFVLEWPTVREPYSKTQLIAAGQFNVSKYVRDNDYAADLYSVYQWVMSAYLTFLFLGLCHRKYKSVVGDRLEG